MAAAGSKKVSWWRHQRISESVCNRREEAENNKPKKRIIWRKCVMANENGMANSCGGVSGS